MDRRTSAPFLALAALLSGCASGTPASDPDPVAERPTEAPPATEAGAATDGLFTADQAARGQDTFAGVCADCHYTSELRGSQFLYTWRRRSVGDLLEYVSESMPEDRPGTLTDRQYADVVAYILELNGAAPGPKELPFDVAALESHGMAALPGREP